MLVRHKGTTLLARGYGYADSAARRPNTPETTFQIASVSKQFTAAAILLLQERGVLSVDDGIAPWFPGCPREWEAITIHQLLTHTSGIGHWHDFSEVSLYDPNTRKQVLHQFQQKPLAFRPGSAWSYSSPGYVLLAQIVECSTGLVYGDFLQAALFDPAGMNRTSIGSAPPDPALAAVGYSHGNHSALFELDTVGMGAGDAWSTIDDLERWDATLATPALLTERSLQLMFMPHAAVGGDGGSSSEMFYSYGWFVGRFNGRPMRYHPGDNAGFQSCNIWLPEDDTVVITLANDDQINARAIAFHIAGELQREANADRSLSS